MSKIYELVLFTASVQSYASPIISLIDPEKKISHRLYRHHCRRINGSYVKDLSKLGRNLKDVSLIKNKRKHIIKFYIFRLFYSIILHDDTCYNVQTDSQFQAGRLQVVYINRLGEDRSDSELAKVTRVLEKLSKKYDVRKYMRRIVKSDCSRNVDYVGKFD